MGRARARLKIYVARARQVLGVPLGEKKKKEGKKGGKGGKKKEKGEKREEKT